MSSSAKLDALLRFSNKGGTIIQKNSPPGQNNTYAEEANSCHLLSKFEEVALLAVEK